MNENPNLEMLVSRIAELEKSDDIKWLEDECCDLTCHSIATGGDDYVVGWRVVQHYQAKPHDRIIGFGNSPAEAIKNARATLSAEGAA